MRNGNFNAKITLFCWIAFCWIAIHIFCRIYPNENDHTAPKAKIPLLEKSICTAIFPFFSQNHCLLFFFLYCNIQYKNCQTQDKASGCLFLWTLKCPVFVITVIHFHSQNSLGRKMSPTSSIGIWWVVVVKKNTPHSKQVNVCLGKRPKCLIKYQFGPKRHVHCAMLACLKNSGMWLLHQPNFLKQLLAAQCSRIAHLRVTSRYCLVLYLNTTCLCAHSRSNITRRG